MSATLEYFLLGRGILTVLVLEASDWKEESFECPWVNLAGAGTQTCAWLSLAVGTKGLTVSMRTCQLGMNVTYYFCH